eukprot:scaffold8602_cov196-Amphora_coffeaeformis.AAC.14
MEEDPSTSSWLWLHHKRERTNTEEEEDDTYASSTPARKRRRCSPSSFAATVTPPQIFYAATCEQKPQDQIQSSCTTWAAMHLGGGRPQPHQATVILQDEPEEQEMPRSSSRFNHLLRMGQALVFTTDHDDDDDDNNDGDNHHNNNNAREEEEEETSFHYYSVANPPMFFPIHHKRLHRPLRWGRILLCLVGLLVWTSRSLLVQTAAVDHILTPTGGAKRGTVEMTLRDFLTHEDGFSLGMAPAFFGFYGYFGILAAWEENVSADLLKPQTGRLQQVAGASAGAMAAVLLAAGVSPLKAAEFCADISLADFADPPGVLSVFRGNRFEEIMEDYLDKESACVSLLLEDAMFPVAVSAFDLQSMAGQVLTKGSMARAARASATFPLLFQPVGWSDNDNQNSHIDYTLIDGGLADKNGLAGLMGRNPGRVVNLVVGSFWGNPPGPSEISDASAVVSVSLQNLPQPGPWAMELGPVAVKAASKAMKASLDTPLYKGREDNHYELHIDASSFWK